MMRRLRRMFATGSRDPRAQESAETCIRHCVAVLLVEIAHADHSQDEHEDREISRQLSLAFSLSEEEAAALLAAARQEVEQSVSLQQFTRRLHEVMSYDEKRRVVEMMWRIALADRRLDKYEDYMVGKIAELLYISRGDVLRERNRVQESIFPQSGAP